eukprot:symbB.v1.2.017701.t2/scaffold1385.1/size122333/10
MVLGNLLSDLPPGIFKDLRWLVRIDVSQNRLASLPRGVFESLPRLAQLELRDNLLQELPSEAFRNLPSLQNLSLQNNVLRSIAPDAFQAVPSLQRLDLAKNQLSGILDPTALRGLSNLRHLDLSQNHLRGIQTGALALKNLHSLDLSSNDLRNLSWTEVLQNLTSLERVWGGSVVRPMPHHASMAIANVVEPFQWHLSHPSEDGLDHSYKLINRGWEAYSCQYERIISIACHQVARLFRHGLLTEGDPGYEADEYLVDDSSDDLLLGSPCVYVGSGEIAAYLGATADLHKICILKSDQIVRCERKQILPMPTQQGKVGNWVLYVEPSWTHQHLLGKLGICMEQTVLESDDTEVHQTVVFPAPYPESAPCVVALPLKKLVALPIFNTDDLTPWEHILSQFNLDTTLPCAPAQRQQETEATLEASDEETKSEEDLEDDTVAVPQALSLTDLKGILGEDLAPSDVELEDGNIKPERRPIKGVGRFVKRLRVLRTVRMMKLKKGHRKTSGRDKASSPKSEVDKVEDAANVT